MTPPLERPDFLPAPSSNTGEPQGNRRFSRQAAEALPAEDKQPDEINNMTSNWSGRKGSDELIAFEAGVLSQVSDAVIVTDNDHRITFWNQAAERLYGFRADKVLGRTVEEVCHYQWLTPGDEQAACDSLATTGAWRGENIHAKRNGEEIRVDSSVTVIKDQTGAASNFLFVIRDITARARKEEALAESQNRLRRIYNSTSDLMFLLSVEGGDRFRFLSVNRSYQAVTGFSEEQVMGKRVEEVLPLSASAFLTTKYKEAVQTGKPIQYEMSVDLPAGRVTVETTVAPILDEKGKCARLFGVAHDITGRKRTEDQLRATQKRLEHLLSDTPAMIFSFKPSHDYELTFVSDNVTSQFGYQPREFLEDSKFWEKHIHPDDKPRVLRELASLFQQGQITYEYRFLHRDGKWRWVRDQLKLVRDGAGNPVEILGCGMDITERRQAAEALMESETRFRELVNSLPQIVFETDEKGYLTSANQKAFGAFGYEHEDLAQRLHLLQMIIPEERQRAEQNMWAVLKGVPSAAEYTALRKDGSTFPVLAYSGPILQGGHPVGLRGIVVDITDRKQAEKELRQLSSCLLNVQDEERRRIARDLHDTVGQHLSALEMNITVVEEAAPSLKPRAREALAESHSLTKWCLHEVRTLSYLLYPPLLDEMGLGRALRYYGKGFSRRSGIRVRVEVPPQLGRLPREVETALFRIVQECLANVHRHSGSPKARIRLVQSSAALTLQVKDEGRGIPSGIFSKGNGSVAGLGVGIRGMRERLRQIGGRLEIVSSSKGTTVRAILPLSEGSK